MLRPLGSRRATGWSMRTDRRTDGQTDGLPYLCRSSDRYSYTGATLFRRNMLSQKKKLNTSGRFTQDDTDVTLNRNYIHVKGAESSLDPHDSLHSNLRFSILFLLSCLFSLIVFYHFRISEKFGLISVDTSHFNPIVTLSDFII